MDKLIKKIINSKTHVYFISPHLDDAVFSAGSLLLLFAQRKAVTLITVFTQASPPPYTFSARRNLQICGHSNAQVLFAARRREDIAVCKKLGIKYLHLGFTDALWRKKDKPNHFLRKAAEIFPEIIHLYPFYQLNVRSNHISNQDNALDRVKVKLSKLVSQKKAYLFCPLAFDSHIDHVIVRNICRNLNQRLIYWLDYPYHVLPSKNALKFIKKSHLFSSSLEVNFRRKRILMDLYESQIPPTFPNGISHLPPERFYYRTDL